jgi:hypothetical protein
MNVAVAHALEPDPIELDPRPCGTCGLTIDRHEMVDDGDGPEFFCADLSPDEMTLAELERRSELIRKEEVAAIFVRLEAMDDPSRRPPRDEARPPYRTPQATVDAFWYVVRLADPEQLAAWLDNHPRDESFLLKLLERK